MKLWNGQVKMKNRIVGAVATGGALALSVGAHAQETGPEVPEELTAMLADGGTLALSVVGLAIAAYAVWRGGLIAFNVAKRMLGKAGL